MKNKVKIDETTLSTIVKQMVTHRQPQMLNIVLNHANIVKHW
jgi:hypothetical protein